MTVESTSVAEFVRAASAHALLFLAPAEMVAVGYLPAALFLHWPGLDQATHDMLLVHHAHYAQRRRAGPSSSAASPTRPSALVVSSSPTAISPSNQSSASPSCRTTGEYVLAGPGSFASLEQRLEEISVQTPQTGILEAYTPYASDSDASTAASSSTSSFEGDTGVSGRYANWRRPPHSRKRRSDDLSAGRPPVTVRTESWSSDAGFVGETLSPVRGSSGAIEWATPVGEAGAPLVTNGRHPTSSTASWSPSSAADSRGTRASPPPKRRKSVSETAPASGDGRIPRPAFSIPLAPSLTRSLSDPNHPSADGPAASVTRQGPFSSTGMPKPPRLRSVSAYVSPVAATSEPQIKPSTPFTSAPATGTALTPSDRSTTTLSPPPALQLSAVDTRVSQSAPGSVLDAPLVEGSRPRRTSRTPRIPGSLSVPAGSSSLDAGLNPVVEVNTEWVPIRPRIRTAIRRKLEQRRAEVLRTEHVLEESRPPPVVPVVEKAAKKQTKARARRGGKARSSSSASELESSDATAGSRRSSARAKTSGRPHRRGKAPSVSAQSSEEEDGDSDDEVEDVKIFEHGPTELPPRRTCRTSTARSH
jgi:hypothetical protein